MSSLLAGKVAVITGGSRGLGYAIAYQAKRLLGRVPELQPLATRIVEARRTRQHG